MRTFAEQSFRQQSDMGHRGRQLVEQRFDKKQVVARTVAAMMQDTVRSMT